MKNGVVIRRFRQQGATLVVALVMLVLMTLLAISAINLSTGNLKMIGNMQYQQEATSAAQAAINQVLSKAIHFTKPSSTPEQIAVNVNGQSYTVQVTEPCLRSAAVITIKELSSLPPAEALRCRTSSAVVNSGLLGQNPGGMPSDCSRVVWELKATVDDPTTNARAELVEGASIKMDRILADAYKNDPAMRCS
jgi:Tfp pilus assembly protein PilX